MDAEINNVIYMELNLGPKIANSTCGKTIDVKTIDRHSTVLSSTSMSQNNVILIFTATGISSLTSVVILIYYSLVTEFSFLAITPIYTNRYVLVSH